MLQETPGLRVLSSTALNEMSKSERDRVLAELAAAATGERNAQYASIEAWIHDYEVRYETLSVDLHGQLREGTMRETAAISVWLFLLSVRERIGR